MEESSLGLTREELAVSQEAAGKIQPFKILNPVESEGNAKGDGDQVVAEWRKVSPDHWLPSFNHFPGFPHLVLPRKPSHANQTYARSFFASGHGYALFMPETTVDVPDDYKQIRGISIGDVGILTRNSEFAFAFNIFLPADHPYNKNKTPDSFCPLDPLEESEVCTSVDYFQHGSVIASKGVVVTRHSEDPLHLSFSSSEPQGSLLILPEGATRQNISTNTTRVLDYVALNAVKWASFFANEHGYSAANGATYVVTGVDKTSACSMLTFPSRPLTIKMSATYEAGKLFALEGMSIVGNEGRTDISTPISNNLCVFMRGIRIGLGSAEWTENVDETPEHLAPYAEVFIVKPRLPLLKSKFFLKSNYTQSLEQKPAFSTHPFHPSDAIAQVMLSKSPDASVVLVDDSVWSIFYEEILGRTPEVPLDPLTFSNLRRASFDDFGMMLEEIFGLFDVVENQGVLKLVRNSKKIVTEDAWFTKLWHWLTARRRLHPGDALKELLRQGRFHVETNDWVTPSNEDDNSTDTSE